MAGGRGSVPPYMSVCQEAARKVLIDEFLGMIHRYDFTAG